MREELEQKRYMGIRGNPGYERLKNTMMHNKIRTHEYNENSKFQFLNFLIAVEKIIEIKRNNQHLLNKLLFISKGKNCPVNQKNLKVEKAPSKSLNHVNL